MEISTRWRQNYPKIPRTLNEPKDRHQGHLQSTRLPLGTLSTWRQLKPHKRKPNWKRNIVGQGKLRSSKMAVSKIQRKRIGLYAHSHPLNTGYSNGRRRPGLSICSTSDTLIQPKKEIMTNNGMSIRPGRGHKLLKKRGTNHPNREHKKIYSQPQNQFLYLQTSTLGTNNW